MDTPSKRPNRATVRAPAKLNIYLQIGDVREDGYHDITTVYQTIDLFEEVAVTDLSQEDGECDKAEFVHISLSGPESNESIPTDGHNLASKAAKLLAQRYGITPKLHLDISKRIPARGGLGGGSADAAATLIGCNIIWDLHLRKEELMALGALLGEDVPVHIQGGMAIGVGHKQPLIPIPAGPGDHYPHHHPDWYWVLGVPYGDGLSTRDVFVQLDAMKGTRGAVDFASAHNTCLATSWGTENPETLAPRLSNDLERPAGVLLPALVKGLEEGRRDENALAGFMTGSGSTCVFLARSAEGAEALARNLKERELFRNIILAKGPAEGACMVDY